MDLIIPAGGKSSRFPDTRPKWLLTHPDASLMVIAAIRGLPLENFDRVFLVVLREHLEKHRCEDGLRLAFSELGLAEKLQLVILDEPTRNQPETVLIGIERGQVDGAFYVKDSDNYFEVAVEPENAVSVFNLNDLNEVDASNKSYVSTNGKGLITNIVEKQIISDVFCCGGYCFESARDYRETFEQLKDNDNLYISHIIFQMMLSQKAFKTQRAKRYEDWGTKDSWNKYKSTFATIFLDLDGVIVQSSGKCFGDVWGQTEAITKNRDRVNELYDTGRVEIILTTSRTEDFREETIAQLERIGQRYHRLILGLQHSRRILINDYASSNPYPSVHAINIQRNSDNELSEMLASVHHLQY